MVPRVPLETLARGAHNGEMRQHAFFMIAAGAMVALSILLVFRPHHDGRVSSPPYTGLIGDQCAATPDTPAIPVEYSCKKR
jgi:hypothetical protein